MTHLQKFTFLELLESHIGRAALAGDRAKVERLKSEWERLVKEGDITYKPNKTKGA